MKFLELSKTIEDLELEAEALVCGLRSSELANLHEFDSENYDLIDAVVEFLSADTEAARQRKRIQRFYRETGYYAAHVGTRLVLGKKWIDGLTPDEARQKFVEELAGAKASVEKEPAGKEVA
nr:hypothetical protein [Micromonospora sp. DSM 115978]